MLIQQVDIVRPASPQALEYDFTNSGQTSRPMTYFKSQTSWYSPITTKEYCMHFKIFLAKVVSKEMAYEKSSLSRVILV